MKLKDYLKGVDEQISLGAKEAYFFIGSKDELIEKLPQLDEGFKRGLAKRICEAEKRLELMKTYLENYVPLEDREVLDTSKRRVDSGIGVKIEGIESGKYWMKSEMKGEE